MSETHPDHLPRASQLHPLKHPRRHLLRRLPSFRVQILAAAAAAARMAAADNIPYPRHSILPEAQEHHDTLAVEAEHHNHTKEPEPEPPRSSFLSVHSKSTTADRNHPTAEPRGKGPGAEAEGRMGSRSPSWEADSGFHIGIEARRRSCRPVSTL